MAQRKAKKEQDEKEKKLKEAERLQQEQEEKQSRRKSQLTALKAAMHEIKQKQGEDQSQKAVPTTSGEADTCNSNVQILKKNTTPKTTASKLDGDSDVRSSFGQGRSKSDKVRKDTDNRTQMDDMTKKGSWRRAKASLAPSVTASKAAPPPPPPKYSYTIGQSPSVTLQQQKNLLHKAELQPDRSSVKFTRDRSEVTNQRNKTGSSVKPNNEAVVQAKGQESKGITTKPKKQIAKHTADTTKGNKKKGNKEKNYQRVIVAFDDASGHPSTEKKNNKNKHNNKIMNNNGANDVTSISKSNDDNNDEEVASTKTSSSRRRDLRFRILAFL